MATVRYLSSNWIGVLLLLSFFDDGECMGPKNRRCDCGETTFSGTSGTVTSPYYPNDYRNFCDCTYTITVTSPNRIRLKFNNIEFGDGACSHDYIRVYDGQATSVSLIWRYCSNRYTPTTLTSTTHTIIIVFHSDARRVGQGFHATYSVVSPTTEVPTTRVTTHSTTTIQTTTRVTTTTVTTPLITSSVKSTSILPSTLAPTTSKEATFPILRSKRQPDISPESAIPFVTQGTNEKTRTILTNASTTAAPNLSTNMLEAQAQSSLLNYVWILPIIILVVLIVLAVFLLCYVKSKRSVKTSRVNGNRETTDYVQPDVLAVGGTTVIVNQTYQSNDDFITNVVYQPVEDNIVNATTVKTESNNTAVVDPKADGEFQDSPLYQTADISVAKPEATAHNYDRLVDDKSPSDHRSPVDSVYQYADIDKSQYQYADSTHRYDYAQTATLPISDKHTAKTNTHGTYEALNPLNRETDAGIPRNAVTESVSYSTSDSVHGPQYMGLEGVDKKPYQELLMTKEDGFVDNEMYSGARTEDGYLYPDVAKMVGKGLPQEAGYDLVDMGAYAVVAESSKDESNLNSMQRSGTFPKNDAYDVVNVNSEGATEGQGSRKSKNKNDVENGETYETLTYRDPSEVNLSYNETGYLDYKGNETTAYQPLKSNVNSLFGPKPHRR